MGRVSKVREEAQTLVLGLGWFYCFFSFFFFLPPPCLTLPAVVHCQQVLPVYSCCFWLGHLSGLVTAEVWSAAFGEQHFLGPCKRCLFHLCHGCVHPKVCIPVLSLIPKPGPHLLLDLLQSLLIQEALGVVLSLWKDCLICLVEAKILLLGRNSIGYFKNTHLH